MNNIALSKNYIPTLDELYRREETSSVLNSSPKDIKMGANAGEFLVAKYVLDGPGDYSRNSGYTRGSISSTWESHKANYDRGRKFEIDTMDNEESAEIAFGKLAGQYAKHKQAPESDAFTYATLAGTSGVVGTEETLSTGDEVLTSIKRDVNAMDEEEVDSTSRYLFITPTALRNAQLVEKYKSTGVLDEFVKIVKVPQKRFYTMIDLLDGSTQGEEVGGYVKTETTYKQTTDQAVVTGKKYFTRSGSGTAQSPYVFTKIANPTTTNIATYYEVDTLGGLNINYMIVEKSAIIKWPKHTASDIIVPENNPDADAYIQKFRKYGIVDVYDNKVAGIRYSYQGL